MPLKTMTAVFFILSLLITSCEFNQTDDHSGKSDIPEDHVDVYPYGIDNQLHENSPSVNTPPYSTNLQEFIGTSGVNHPYTIPAIASPSDFATTYYFDSDAANGGDGSRESPFNNLNMIMNGTYPDNCALLLKAGSVFLNSYLNVETDQNDIYIGSYGDGRQPIVTNVNDLSNPTEHQSGFTLRGENLTVNGLHLVGGFSNDYSVMIGISPNLDGEGNWIDGGKNLTIANSHLESIKMSGGKYVYYIFRGGAINMTLYNNEIAYAREDIWYASSRFSNYVIVSNYFHHANMKVFSSDGLNVRDRDSWTAAGGDIIQFEYAGLDGAYFANNFFDRSDSAGKFCLIFNGGDANSNITVEYNTFLNPVDVHGGAAVQFHTNGILRNNLFLNADPEGGVSGLASYEVFMSQATGNHFVGYNGHETYNVNWNSLDSSNKAYEDLAAYKAELSPEERMGSDLF